MGSYTLLHQCVYIHMPERVPASTCLLSLGSASLLNIAEALSNGPHMSSMQAYLYFLLLWSALCSLNWMLKGFGKDFSCMLLPTSHFPVPTSQSIFLKIGHTNFQKVGRLLCSKEKSELTQSKWNAKSMVRRRQNNYHQGRKYSSSQRH